MAELDPKLKADLERYGRLCMLAQVQLGQGAPGFMVLAGVQGMQRLLEEVAAQLEASQDVWVQVDPHLGENMSGFIAETYGKAPDFPPDDLR